MWVVTSDNAADQRSVEATLIDDVAVVTKGISAGEHIVVNGQYRLQAGSKVDVTSDRADSAPGKAS